MGVHLCDNKLCQCTLSIIIILNKTGSDNSILTLRC